MSANECIVVTGGSGGIGRACVTQIADANTSVFNLDIAPCNPLPGETFVETDLCDAGAIEASFRRIAKDRAIVGLVNNAGSAVAHSLAETEAEDFTRLVSLNLVAPALCARFAVESMKTAGWGRIVNISSRAALGKELRTAYAATKGGIAAMTRVWALELAASGITVNTVGPGPIATELFRRVNPDGSPKTRQIIDSIPVKRLGTPEDIANAVMFFLKKESGFVTGQTLYACGGLTVGLTS
jgi:3-oxoacyl-[acyl-carrier protein] reductase